MKSNRLLYLFESTINMKRILTALLPAFLSLNLIVSAVPVFDIHVETAAEPTETAETTAQAALSEDKITYMWDFEDASSQT